MNAMEFVAEHVMGFERGDCWGTLGGADIGSDGTSETWYYCDWCGAEIHDGQSGPCPRYPFPGFWLYDLMRRLGEMGHQTMVRFDPLRESSCFTICLDGSRICDTDEPFEALCAHLAKQRHRFDLPLGGQEGDR